MQSSRVRLMESSSASRLLPDSKLVLCIAWNASQIQSRYGLDLNLTHPPGWMSIAHPFPNIGSPPECHNKLIVLVYARYFGQLFCDVALVHWTAFELITDQRFSETVLMKCQLYRAIVRLVWLMDSPRQGAVHERSAKASRSSRPLFVWWCMLNTAVVFTVERVSN